MPTITYSDTLYFDALMREIERAQRYIMVMSFVFRTDYVGATRSKQVMDALIAAAARGVEVFVHTNPGKATR